MIHFDAPLDVIYFWHNTIKVSFGQIMTIYTDDYLRPDDGFDFN